MTSFADGIFSNAGRLTKQLRTIANMDNLHAELQVEETVRIASVPMNLPMPLQPTDSHQAGRRASTSGAPPSQPLLPPAAVVSTSSSSMPPAAPSIYSAAPTARAAPSLLPPRPQPAPSPPQPVAIGPTDDEAADLALLADMREAGIEVEPRRPAVVDCDDGDAIARSASWRPALTTAPPLAALAPAGSGDPYASSAPFTYGASSSASASSYDSRTTSAPPTAVAIASYETPASATTATATTMAPHDIFLMPSGATSFFSAAAMVAAGAASAIGAATGTGSGTSSGSAGGTGAASAPAPGSGGGSASSNASSGSGSSGAPAFPGTTLRRITTALPGMPALPSWLGGTAAPAASSSAATRSAGGASAPLSFSSTAADRRIGDALRDAASTLPTAGELDAPPRAWKFSHSGSSAGNPALLAATGGGGGSCGGSSISGMLVHAAGATLASLDACGCERRVRTGASQLRSTAHCLFIPVLWATKLLLLLLRVILSCCRLDGAAGVLRAVTTRLSEEQLAAGLCGITLVVMFLWTFGWGGGWGGGGGGSTLSFHPSPSSPPPLSPLP